MERQELKKYIQENITPDISKRFQLKALIDEYPYFQAGLFLYLKCLFVAGDNSFRQELQRLICYINDSKALFYYVLSNEYETFFSRKGERKELDRDRTEILLNAFFENTDDTAIDLQIERTIAGTNLANSDYFSYLESLQDIAATVNENKDESRLKYQDIIDNFIEKTNQGKTIELNTEQVSLPSSTIKEKSDEELSKEMQDDLFFTETLAGIYIKQKKYERAYEIIKRLSLNYPEKNIYFADQISFLEKLIINKKSKK